MADVGLEAAGGIAAGYKTLADIIAMRKRDEIIAQKMEEARQQQDLQVAQFHETQRQNQANEVRLGEQDKYLGELRTEQAGKYAQDVKTAQMKEQGIDHVYFEAAGGHDGQFAAPAFQECMKALEKRLERP